MKHRCNWCLCERPRSDLKRIQMRSYEGRVIRWQEPIIMCSRCRKNLTGQYRIASRVYPCEAIFIGRVTHSRLKGKNLFGMKVTVLTPAEAQPCCCERIMHRIELPKGYPDPPKRCPTWMVESRHLKFLD